MRFLSGGLKSMGKVVLMMYVVTAVILFILGLLVQKFQWGDAVISVGISITYVISCFVGGFFAGKIQQTKKFIWGILMGMFYIIIMLVITLIVKSGFHSNVSGFLSSLLLCLGSGMLGGMLS